MGGGGAGRGEPGGAEMLLCCTEAPRACAPRLLLHHSEPHRTAGRRSPRLHAFVRQSVCQQLCSQPERYAEYVPGPYRQYCADMARPGAWGDHVTLQVTVWGGDRDCFATVAAGGAVCVFAVVAVSAVLLAVPSPPCPVG